MWYAENKTLLKKKSMSVGKHYQFYSSRVKKNAKAFFKVTFKLLSLLHKMPLAKIMLLL